MGNPVTRVVRNTFKRVARGVGLPVGPNKSTPGDYSPKPIPHQADHDAGDRKQREAGRND